MNALIIEDEIPARAKLVQMLQKMHQDISIVAQLGSVHESLAWLRSNPPPDLAFVDIQLSDDHSFRSFREFNVTFPVVFTTAYDKYLMESFEFNSIDYLLKPITEEKLQRSLQKVKTLRQHFIQGKILEMLKNQDDKSAKRLVARRGAEYVALEPEDVAYFYTEHKVVFVKDFSGRKLMVDYNLGELEEMLKNKNFFRINRKFLANAKAIDRFKPDNGKILIYLRPEMKEDIHVSKETAPFFRTWIGV